MNEACRFYDERVGQSVTLTGRSIVRHMASEINRIITGAYDAAGESIVYGDTDSCYFSVYEALRDTDAFHEVDWTNREGIIALYDDIAEGANASFPAFMQANFHTTRERGAIIRAGRELIAGRGLFIKKKKYAVLMYDKEGKRLDVDGKPGKIKAMGLDLKRADTPKYMQDFLNKLLMDLLTDVPKDRIFDDIRAFRRAFKARPAWEKGSPKKVAGLSNYAAQRSAAEAVGLTGRRRKGQKLKVNMPGHVTASLNWNLLCNMEDDRFAQRITDGTRIIVCKLKANAWGMDSIAYPIDELRLPPWFKALPFNGPAMEQVIVDQKLMNLVEVLGWDLTPTYTSRSDSAFSWV